MALAVLATPASAAVLRIEFEGEVASTTLVVRAAPGEVNRMTLVGTPGGSVVVRDDGAALRGCRPASGGGRLCDGPSPAAEAKPGLRAYWVTLRA